MTDYLKDGPAHRALQTFGLAATRAADAAGDRAKLLVTLLVTDRGVEVAANGCCCDACQLSALTALAHHFGAEVEVTETSEPVH